MEDDDDWDDGGWSDDENFQSNSEFSIFQKFILEGDYWSIFQNRTDLVKLDKDERIRLSKLFKSEPNDGDSYVAYLLCSGFVCQSANDMNGNLNHSQVLCLFVFRKIGKNYIRICSRAECNQIDNFIRKFESRSKCPRRKRKLSNSFYSNSRNRKNFTNGWCKIISC